MGEEKLLKCTGRYRWSKFISWTLILSALGFVLLISIPALPAAIKENGIQALIFYFIALFVLIFFSIMFYPLIYYTFKSPYVKIQDNLLYSNKDWTHFRLIRETFDLTRIRTVNVDMKDGGHFFFSNEDSSTYRVPAGVAWQMAKAAGSGKKRATIRTGHIDPIHFHKTKVEDLMVLDPKGISSVGIHFNVEQGQPNYFSLDREFLGDMTRIGPLFRSIMQYQAGSSDVDIVDLANRMG